MTLTVRSATVTGATTKGDALTHAELDENFNHLRQSTNHTFTQSGTGAVSTDVQEEIRANGHRFESYGAVGDGSTEDQVAIQKAIDAAAVSGGVAYGTPGTTYIVGDDLLPKSNVTLYLPRGTSLKAKAATDVNILNGSSISNFTLCGEGVIDGNLANQTGQVSDSGQADGIRVESCSNVFLRGVKVQNTKGWGVHVGASTEVLADAITVSGTQEKAFNFTASTARSSVVNSFISSAGGGFFPAATGIEVDDAAHDILVQNNVINGTSVIGISVHGHESEAQPYNVNVIGNVVVSAGNIGIRVASHRAADDNLRRVVIANNIINGTDDGAGIAVITNGGASTTTAEDILIQGNEINDANDQGITISLGKRVRVTNNLIRNSGDHGIQIDGGATAADLAQYITVEENNVIDPAATREAADRDGIHVANSSVGVKVLRNHVEETKSGAARRMRWGINNRDSDNDNTQIKGNVIVNPVTGFINDGGTGTIFDDPYVLDQSGDAVSVSAVTTEEVLATITVPANSMGANGRLTIETLWSYTNGANDKTPRIRFSGASGTQYLVTALTSTATLNHVAFIQNADATNAQVGGFISTVAYNASSGAHVTSAVDTTAATTISITGQKEVDSETLTLLGYRVTLTYRP